MSARVWAPGDRLLVAHQGAVLVATMKEPGPKEATVRLLWNDEWHTTGYENLFTFEDMNQAVLKGLRVTS